MIKKLVEWVKLSLNDTQKTNAHLTSGLSHYATLFLEIRLYWPSYRGKVELIFGPDTNLKLWGDIRNTK